ncbi:hypothetical protein LX36DRAFT_259933 [Colletotrichum falcatum]|nr:hypothetical protein LX36DRAFT_259933 [Colletotrichum falcatum]
MEQGHWETETQSNDDGDGRARERERERERERVASRDTERERTRHKRLKSQKVGHGTFRNDWKGKRRTQGRRRTMRQGFAKTYLRATPSTSRTLCRAQREASRLSRAELRERIGIALNSVGRRRPYARHEHRGTHNAAPDERHQVMRCMPPCDALRAALCKEAPGCRGFGVAMVMEPFRYGWHGMA